MTGAAPEWTRAEDAKLLRLAPLYDYPKWSRMQRQFPGRTAAAIAKRHERLITGRRPTYDYGETHLGAPQAPPADTDHVNQLNDMGGFPRATTEGWVDAFGQPWRFDR